MTNTAAAQREASPPHSGPTAPKDKTMAAPRVRTMTGRIPITQRTTLAPPGTPALLGGYSLWTAVSLRSHNQSP